jgi:organic radical activating enzyme
VRFRCPHCEKVFTEYPPFALPHKRFVNQDVLGKAQKYLDRQPPDARATYRESLRKNRYPLGYANQNHARRQPIDGHWAHCFDNWPVDQWLRAFQRHFQTRRLSLVITGGEPLVDHAPMAELVNGLTAMPTVECVRIDTNASLAMEKFQAFDPRKITLMCTFHPSQTTEQRFFRKIDALLSRGFKIGMVNYVLTSETLPEACFFPAVAYQMNPRGRLHVGCHRTRAGSFLDDELPPQFASPVPCPQTTCIKDRCPASLELRVAEFPGIRGIGERGIPVATERILGNSATTIGISGRKWRE